MHTDKTTNISAQNDADASKRINLAVNMLTIMQTIRGNMQCTFESTCTMKQIDTSA